MALSKWSGLEGIWKDLTFRMLEKNGNEGSSTMSDNI